MAETTTVTPPAAPAAPATPPAAPDFLTGLSDDTRGWYQTKGFKAPSDAIESARNLEKLMGLPPERILKLADKMRDETTNAWTPEARQIWERLGAPKEAKDYQIDIPKEYGDAKQADLFRRLFHEEGIPKASAERLVKEWNAFQGANMQAFKDQQEATAKTSDANLRKDWGQAFEQNVNIAKEAARTLGMDQKQVDAIHSALGQEGTMKLFHKLGTSVGEGRYIQGGGANQLMTPSNAQHQIKELSKDKDFSGRLMKGDTEAKAKWQRLHEMAYPEQAS